MKYRTVVSILFFLSASFSFAQTTTVADTANTPPPKAWKCTGIVGLNASAVGLWNWAEGGSPTANGVIFANVTLLYKKNKFAWESNLDSDFGLLYNDNSPFQWRYSNDKLNFTTKFGYEVAESWLITALGSFKSQYAKGYEYLNTAGVESRNYISNWLSPSYTNVSLGIDWQPNTIFSVYLSPAAGRIVTATDSLHRLRYGVDPNKMSKSSFGLSFKGGINYTKIKNLKLITTLSLFTPYNQSFGKFDVDWDFAISYQFLKVLNVTLSTSLRYYDGVLIADKAGNLAPRTQFQTMLGVGVGYSF